MEHTVRSGETLSGIAARYGVSVEGILSANRSIASPHRIRIGQRLRLPPQATNQRRATTGGGTRPTTAGWHVRVWNSVGSFFDRVASFDLFEALGADESEDGDLPWMETARGEIGVAERRGMHNANPRILEYFKASRYWGTDDSSAKNAWCGSFVAWVMKENGYTPVAKAYRAKEWKNFGRTIPTPVYGAIGIKSRTGGGHTAFVIGRDTSSTKLYMLGGNQDDQVQISEYERDVWDTFVVPDDYDTSNAELPVYDETAAGAGRES